MLTVDQNKQATQGLVGQSYSGGGFASTGFLRGTQVDPLTQIGQPMWMVEPTTGNPSSHWTTTYTSANIIAK